MSDGWEKHQEHVLSELRRISDKVDMIDAQMVAFHTNHLSDIREQLIEIRTTIKFVGGIAIVGGPVVIGLIELYFKLAGK